MFRHLPNHREAINLLLQQFSRSGTSLSQKGFEIANGLPLVASDQAIHDLLDAHTVKQAQRLQIALGQWRRATGHFPGRLRNPF